MSKTSTHPRKLKLFVLFTAITMIVFFSWAGKFQPLTFEEDQNEPDGAVAIGETPAITEHINQAAIDAGRLRFQPLFEAGDKLFTARFNFLDGQGRPGATGDGTPTRRLPGSAPDFIRTSGPDANSCAGCHNQPSLGAAGEFVANVFVLAQVLDPVTESVSAEFSNERNSLGMHGAGLIEMLAREMTAELHAIRDQAIQEARKTGQATSLPLITKEVSFGRITARPDGALDTDGVVGVDRDLIIKPFHQKGVVNSLRVFTNNAMNHHFGLQPVERFGRARTGTDDFDQDGVPDELSVGDITAATIFQAGLGTPGRVIPTNQRRRRAMEHGERVFNRIGCAECHRPFLRLDNPVFTEPNPFNPEGNLRPADVPRPFAFDLTREGLRPRPARERDGSVLVRSFTDLKRHVIGDADYPHFLNERVIQGGVPLDQFITRKLWDAGNTAPYGHRGDLTTLTEAILHHGAEGRSARDAFAALSSAEQAAVIEFLKSLQILPEGSPSLSMTDQELESFKRKPRGE